MTRIRALSKDLEQADGPSRHPHLTPMKQTIANTLFLFTSLIGCTLGCSSQTTNSQKTNAAQGVVSHSVFPAGFLFGTATAGFQVDMGCPKMLAEECEDRHSDWYHFVTDPRTLNSERVAPYLSHQPVSNGPGFWELYPDDIALRAAGELKNNAFRMSLEWSRIFPLPTDDAGEPDLANPQAMCAKLDPYADHAAVQRYADMFRIMADHNIKPFVTLNHYTLPDWIHDAVACHRNVDNNNKNEPLCINRGWLDSKRIVREIQKYALYAACKFKDRVDLWVTLNEPMSVVVPGFLLPNRIRTNPPAIQALDKTMAVIKTMADAHRAMRRAIIKTDDIDADGDGARAEVGLVHNLASVEPAQSDTPEQMKRNESGAKVLSSLLNEMLLDDALSPRVGEAELDADFLGLNYYARMTWNELTEDKLPSDRPATFEDYVSYNENYPEGLYNTAVALNGRYRKADDSPMPIYITENGATHAELEHRTPEYLVTHLQSALRAIDDRVNIKGYFYWSLLDNYEWNHGMCKVRMGLYSVEASDTSKQRTKRSIVDLYGSIAENGRIPEDWEKFIPPLKQPHELPTCDDVPRIELPGTF